MILTSSNFLFSQQKSPEALVDSFFVIFKKESIEKSIDYITSTNSYMLQAKETIDAIKQKLLKSLPMIGKYYGYDIYSKKELGDTYSQIKCLLKYDRQPVIMTFIFYKPDNKWKLQNILFEDKLDNDIANQPNLKAK